ncbi:MAG: zinc-ribbon domain-containing protein [Deltaproteobacteria bacterium]|nr:zinc-ribbon domain-containing protein [Deltaproteobacteria bacterium]
MVVKCFNCEALLRVDEKSIPEGEQINVRCPKCGSEGIIGANQHSFKSETDSLQQIQGLESKIVEKPVDQMKDQPLSKTATNSKAGELTLPEDAFKDFRFPGQVSPSSKKSLFGDRRAGKIFFLIASIIVVAIFTILVNLILPGMPPADVEHVTSSQHTHAR